MDAGGACDSDLCCCACDIDVYDCECDFECCDGACGDLCDVCGLEEGIESVCCGFLLCVDSEASSDDVKDDKRAEAAKETAYAPQVIPVKVELLRRLTSQPKPEPPAQLTSV